MNRRELLGAVPALLAGATVTLALPTIVRLDSRVVGCDFSVYDDGDGLRFALRLFDQPWPRVGQRVAFAYDGLEFDGTVAHTRAESVRGSGQFIWHLSGSVQHFEARPVKDGR
jgi:hypothetical protein